MTVYIWDTISSFDYVKFCLKSLSLVVSFGIEISPNQKKKKRSLLAHLLHLHDVTDLEWALFCVFLANEIRVL